MCVCVIEREERTRYRNRKNWVKKKKLKNTNDEKLQMTTLELETITGSRLMSTAFHIKAKNANKFSIYDKKAI